MLYWNSFICFFKSWKSKVEPKQVLYWNAHNPVTNINGARSNRNKCCIEISQSPVSIGMSVWSNRNKCCIEMILRNGLGEIVALSNRNKCCIEIHSRRCDDQLTRVSNRNKCCIEINSRLSFRLLLMCRTETSVVLKCYCLSNILKDISSNRNKYCTEIEN